MEVALFSGMFLVMVRHALQRKRALNELHRLAQGKRDFIRDASHQLKTPIAIALGHAELIRSSRVDGQAGVDIGIVVDELDRLSVIADRLLLLESAEGRDIVAWEVVDVDRLVERVSKRWIRIARRDWRVTVSAHGTFLGDGEQLALALDCLIENALHATSEGDRISVAGRAGGDDVIIEVSDSGSGIPEEDRERIFERFSRGNSRHRGSGLGLAIVKAIVDAHGGTVEVESELDRGTTFSIRIGGFRPAKVVPLGVVQPIDNSRTRAPSPDPQPAA